jgi:hypothetical protein
LKLTKYENPFTGKEGDLLDFSGLFGKVLGVVMFFVIFAAGQNVARMIGKKLPVDTSIEPVVSRPVATTGIQRQVL